MNISELKSVIHEVLNEMNLEAKVTEIEKEVEKLFNEKPYQWSDVQNVLSNHAIGEYQHLAQRVDAEKMKSMMNESKPATPEKTEKKAATGTTTSGAAAAGAATKAADDGLIDIDAFLKVDPIQFEQVAPY